MVWTKNYLGPGALEGTFHVQCRFHAKRVGSSILGAPHEGSISYTEGVGSLRNATTIIIPGAYLSAANSQ